MTGVFYSRDARLSISSSPMIVWARNLFSCILQATSSKPLWYQAIFIVGIIHSQLPSSKFNMPMLCALNHCACRPPSLRCQYFALNHCACRPPSLRCQYFALNHCACRPPSLRGQYFALNHCGCRPPSLKRPKTRNGPPQKKAIWEDEIFGKQWLLSAHCARKKAANIQIGRGCSGAPKARLFLLFDRFGGPGLADRCFRDRLSADLGLNWPSAVPKQSLGSSFWPPGPQLAQRRRQTVFREQFLPTWTLTGPSAVARQSLGSSFCTPGP